MVIKCCVPNCTSKYKREDNVRFHKFPRAKNVFKIWCFKLRLCPNEVEAKIHYVCSNHFQSTDYVDSFGGLRQILRQDKFPSQNLPQPSHTKTINPRVQLKRVRNTIKTKDILIMSRTSETLTQDLQNNSDDQADEPDIMHTEPEPLQNNSDDQADEPNIMHTEPEPSTNTTSTQTDNLMRVQESIYFSSLSGSDFMYYTGLSSQRFLFLFDMLNIISTPYDKYMSPKDQLILTLIKYRQNLQFRLIGKLYGVTRMIVREIFVYFTNCLCTHLKNVDFWALRFQNPYAYTAIIDCPEIVTNSAKNPEQNEVFFSQYKHRHTLKYLVAVDEKGILIYCSDVFGGSVSDKEMLEESGFLKKLKSGDILLADREFDFSDVLAEHGVTLNKQLTSTEVQEPRAHRRIHVKKVIGLAKHNKILSGTFPTSLWPYANKIIYVANMICNYRPNIS